MTDTPATDPFADLDPLTMVSVTWLAKRLGVGSGVVYRAVRSGALPAILPRGADPRRTGRIGYKIKLNDARAWFFPTNGGQRSTQDSEKG